MSVLRPAGTFGSSLFARALPSAAGIASFILRRSAMAGSSCQPVAMSLNQFKESILLTGDKSGGAWNEIHRAWDALRRDETFTSMRGFLKDNKSAPTSWRQCLSAHTSSPCSVAKVGPIASLKDIGLLQRVPSYDECVPGQLVATCVRMIFPNSLKAEDQKAFLYASPRTNKPTNDFTADVCLDILTCLLVAAPNQIRMPQAAYGGSFTVDKIRSCAQWLRIADLEVWRAACDPMFTLTAVERMVALQPPIAPPPGMEDFPRQPVASTQDGMEHIARQQVASTRDDEAVLEVLLPFMLKKGVGFILQPREVPANIYGTFNTHLPQKGLRPFVNRHLDLFEWVDEATYCTFRLRVQAFDSASKLALLPARAASASEPLAQPVAQVGPAALQQVALLQPVAQMHPATQQALAQVGAREAPTTDARAHLLHSFAAIVDSAIQRTALQYPVATLPSQHSPPFYVGAHPASYLQFDALPALPPPQPTRPAPRADPWIEWASRREAPQRSTPGPLLVLLDDEQPSPSTNHLQVAVPYNSASGDTAVAIRQVCTHHNAGSGPSYSSLKMGIEPSNFIQDPESMFQCMQDTLFRGDLRGVDECIGRMIAAKDAFHWISMSTQSSKRGAGAVCKTCGTSCFVRWYNEDPRDEWAQARATWLHFWKVSATEEADGSALPIANERPIV